jgi:hypothetical protein
MCWLLRCETLRRERVGVRATHLKLHRGLESQGGLPHLSPIPADCATRLREAQFHPDAASLSSGDIWPDSIKENANAMQEGREEPYRPKSFFPPLPHPPHLSPFPLTVRSGKCVEFFEAAGVVRRIALRSHETRKFSSSLGRLGEVEVGGGGAVLSRDIGNTSLKT